MRAERLRWLEGVGLRRPVTVWYCDWCEFTHADYDGEPDDDEPPQDRLRVHD